MKLSENKIDVWILIPVLLLIIFGIGAVYSASSNYSLSRFNDANYMLKQHLMKVVIALIVLFFFTNLDYKYYQQYGKLMMWLSIALLVIVFIGFASELKGATRWIKLGPLNFQPSDLAKFTLIIYLSCLLVRKKNYLHLLYKGYLPLLFYIVVVTILVAMQPNFSTSIIIFGSSMLLLLITNVKIKHLAVTMASFIPFVALFIYSKAYIIERLTYHSDFTAGGSSNYQLIQAIIGFGNGGILGVGPGNSLQKEFFLPEAYGDFIYSIVGEEYGFIGTIAVLLLFVIILIRGYKVSKLIDDDFGKYLSFGITTILSSYAVVNMSVACGIIPTTGVPIPFVSYGGTALIINSMAIGILLNISKNSRRTEKVTDLSRNAEDNYLTR
jgi:cell division protein FtsW